MRALSDLASSCLFAVALLVPRPASAGIDDWLNPIKLTHLAGEGAMATVGAGVTRGVFRADRHQAAWYGASAAVVVGGMKELYDWRFGDTRRFDLRDMALNVAGAGLGFASTELASSGSAWPHLKTAGQTAGATGAMMLASSLIMGVSVLPWVTEEQRRRWFAPVGLAGAGGLVLLGGTYLAEYLRSR
jgi:hypothetical protein